MARISWLMRFFAGTRGQLVALLRRNTQTVEELAQELHVTDNAVRAHLAALERDGLVRQRGVRRSGGSGKPAYAYALTADAEELFPKAYVPVLRQVLTVLAQRSSLVEVDALMREVGRSLAREQGATRSELKRGADLELDARLTAAVNVLNDLGGLAELEEGDGQCTIRGYSCPLAAVVTGHPEVCHLAETLLTEVVGAPVHEHCDRDEQPHCCFTLTRP